jgi:hypothetical protein
MEITAPSEQRQQIAEIDAQNKQEGNQLTQVTTKTTDVHGNEIVITTTNPYEQKIFSSKTVSCVLFCLFIFILISFIFFILFYLFLLVCSLSFLF